jgi:TonB dependent receptor
VEIGYNVLTLAHTWSRGSWLNQAHVSGQRSTWNPTVVNDELDIGLQYDDIIRIGARSTEQRFTQDRIALRNDVTYNGFRWLGDHVLKGGVNVDFLNYEVAKRFDGNPTFFFRPTNLDVPYRVSYGEGDPGMDERNVQFGAFLQTDWSPAPRLELNLGVRWDAETNLFNNAWVTPDSIRQQITAWDVPDSIQAVVGSDFPANYLTRGREDRPIFLGAFQPRAGFSYDLSGNGNTVVHGGFGIYYDREIWNRLIDERFRLSWRVRNLEFTTTGEAGKVPWDPDYLSREGLDALIQQGNYGRTGELFLLNNDTRPPRTHQWNLGVRQTLGTVVAGAAYRGVRGYNILSWFCATPHPEHGYCGGAGSLQGLTQNYGVVVSTDEGRTWYDALDLTAEKQYTEQSRWGFTLAYTLADASRKGMDFFTLDFPMTSPADWPRVDMPVERHRLVASGIVGLPWEFRVSSLVQLGSGVRYNTRDEIRGWGPRRVQVGWAEGEGDMFRQIDMRLEKSLGVPGSRARAGLTVEVINLLDEANYREYEALSRFDNGTANASFGQPLWWTADPGRRVQLGLNFGF